jgi:hypothetical protein
MKTYKHAKRIVVAIVGGTLVLIGAALIVLPGPAFLVIPAGLAVLATEFAWARRWLAKAKQMVKSNYSSKPGPPEEGGVGQQTERRSPQTSAPVGDDARSL